MARWAAFQEFNFEYMDGPSLPYGKATEDNPDWGIHKRVIDGYLPAQMVRHTANPIRVALP
eukprot:CAMPEP_0198127742 /NCGR_PEP_ID=MMETSP1442-20131203/47876_1 /TAXON_ID= /ORGANISM="Craspedostauros australis, Strain CCMP3328" /LENGTH=60 /DNA_ID=CAMNT_0043787777 /DNA_START=18 /DNA_END=196 /DNA_ORIENTATION=+